MRTLPLYDQLGWKVLSNQGTAELRALVGAGLAILRCRTCGGYNTGSKGRVPKNFASIEDWLQYLDSPVVAKNCSKHLLEHHVTPEFKLEPTTHQPLGRPDRVGLKRAILFHSVGDRKLPTHAEFTPTRYVRQETDFVHELLIRER
jgi:hypothetical protein